MTASSPSVNSPHARPSPFCIGWKERTVVLSLLFGSLALAAMLAQTRAPDKLQEIVALIPLTAVALGKFLPLWGITGGSDFSPWGLGIVVWLMDTFTVVVLVYSSEALYRVPGLARRLDRLHDNARLVLTAYPSIKKATILGVTLFVLFPVTGTGALVGTILGVILGLNRFVLLGAVSAGGFIGGFLMAFLATYFQDFLGSFQAAQDSSTVKWATLATLFAVIGSAVYFLNRLYQRALLTAQQEPSSREGRER